MGSRLREIKSEEPQSSQFLVYFLRRLNDRSQGEEEQAEKRNGTKMEEERPNEGARLFHSQP